MRVHACGYEIRGCANLHPPWFASPRVADQHIADCRTAIAHNNARAQPTGGLRGATMGWTAEGLGEFDMTDHYDMHMHVHVLYEH